MAILGFELEEIARIVALVESRGLAELVIEEEGRYLRVRGPLAEQTKSFATSVTPPMIAAPAPVQAPAVPAAPTKRKERRADSNEEAPGGCVSPRRWWAFFIARKSQVHHLLLMWAIGWRWAKRLAC